MILTFIGIQTLCVVAASGYVIKNFTPKKARLKVSSNVNGYKIYKTF
jgi:hypothetical protein